MTAPLISVIIPAYAVSQYIAETLDSVFAQTRSDFEAIVIDDGSPDTPALEAALAPYLSRIVYLKQPKRGVSAARNLGIGQARGEFLAFLDADDLWLPDCLCTQLQAFRNDPSLDMIWADLVDFGESPTAGHRAMSRNCSEKPVTLERLVLGRSVATTSSVMVRRQAAIEAGLFDEAFARSEDFDLWLRIASRGGRLDFQRVLVGRRRIRLGAASRDAGAMAKALVAVLDKLAGQTGLAPEVLAAIDWQRRRATAEAHLAEGHACLEQKRYPEAAEAFRRANAFFGRRKLTYLMGGLRIAPGLIRLAAKLWSAWLDRRLARRRTEQPAPKST